MYNVKIFDYGEEKQIRTYSNPIKKKGDEEHQYSDEQLKEIREQKKKHRQHMRDIENWTPWGIALNDLNEEDYPMLLDLMKEIDPEYYEEYMRILEYDKNKYIHTAASRAKQMIYQKARANKWEHFLTLTFSPDKNVDRFDYRDVGKKVSKWLNHLREECQDLKYLGVPEQHKNGAWHFHFLVSGLDRSRIVDSGKVAAKNSQGKNIVMRKEKAKEKGFTGRTIYNYEKYKWGFSEVTEIENTYKASAYITKYITKGLYENTDGLKGVKRYWPSKNLKKAETEERLLPPDELKRLQDEMLQRSKLHKQAKAYLGLINPDGKEIPQVINYYEIDV